MRRRRNPLMLVLAGVGLLAGCTSGADEAAPTGRSDPPSETIAGDSAGPEDGYSIAYESPDADDFNRLLDPEQGLEELQPVEILNVDTVGVDRLVISFEMESHHCFGVMTAVDETEAEVVIDVRSGRRPGVDGAECTYGIFPYTTAVELASPLGDRVIVQAEPMEPAAAAGTGDVARAPGPEGGNGLEGIDTSVVEGFLGDHVEEGVEWAILNGVEWRILSYDGEPMDTDGPVDPERLSFVVEGDLIVAYEWS